MRNTQVISTKKIFSSSSSAEERQISTLDKFRWFEVVDDYLVSPSIINTILKAVDGRILQGHAVLSIPAIVGQGFYENLDDDERAVVGKCILKLIDSGDIKVELPEG
jgi:hypothetical protein